MAQIAEFTTKVGSGATPRGGSESYKQAGIPLIRSQNVHLDGFHDEGLAYIDEKQAAALDDVLVHANDVLLNITGASIGRVTLAPSRMQGARVNQHVCIVRPVNGVLPHYLAGYLANPEMQTLIMAAEYGVTRQALTKGQILSFEIPIAPTVEQKRIMAKVEALLARVNAARERLAKVPAILKRFRQSVLAAACSGQLTAEWRERHTTVEDGHAILSRIADLRGTPQPANAVKCPDDIPPTWAWAAFGYVMAELRNGISTRPEMEPPGNPMLRISAVRPGKVLLDDARYLPQSDHLVDTYSIRDGDLLFTRYNGSIELLGVCGMVHNVGEDAVLYPDKLMRVRFDHSWILPTFVEIFFQGPEARERLMGEAKSSAGQQGVSGKNIKMQGLAIPPVEEQHEIVRRVEALFALADKIEARVQAVTIRVEKITQAILAKAFRGELVPTEAELARQEGRDYEPASVLLERIRRARANSETSDTKHRSHGRKLKDGL